MSGRPTGAVPGAAFALPLLAPPPLRYTYRSRPCSRARDLGDLGDLGGDASRERCAEEWRWAACELAISREVRLSREVLATAGVEPPPPPPPPPSPGAKGGKGDGCGRCSLRRHAVAVITAAAAAAAAPPSPGLYSFNLRSRRVELRLELQRRACALSLEQGGALFHSTHLVTCCGELVL